MVNPRELEGQLLAARPGPLSGLLPERYVLPRYDGRSIANLPATIGRLLGVQHGWAAPPLEAALLPEWQDVERVILLLVDGIGWRRLWETVEQQDTAFPRLLEQWGATVAPITSVSPSTTSAATTTLWGNGAAPAEHGMMGFSFLLMEQSVVGNMLFWKPAARGPEATGELIRWGMEPTSFLHIPSLAHVLSAGGVGTTSLMPRAIAHSPLSNMQQRGAEVVGYLNATDMWLKLRDWTERNRGRRAYCYAYYPDFDEFSHRDGPDAPSWASLWREFRFHLDAFVADLPASARGKTALILTADHGHVFSPLAKRHLTQKHPDLLRHLSLMPGGEARHMYLYARHGRHDAIREYYQAHLAEDFHLLDAVEALQAGLYGPTEHLHPDAERRIGDFVMLSKGGAMMWTGDPNTVLLGMHGSLEPEEMIVPYIALRLDA